MITAKTLWTFLCDPNPYDLVGGAANVLAADAGPTPRGAGYNINAWQQA